jgi:hypothetical protein
MSGQEQKDLNTSKYRETIRQLVDGLAGGPLKNSGNDFIASLLQQYHHQNCTMVFFLSVSDFKNFRNQKEVFFITRTLPL